jgi:hypothetical protein
VAEKRAVWRLRGGVGEDAVDVGANLRSASRRPVEDHDLEAVYCGAPLDVIKDARG